MTVVAFASDCSDPVEWKSALQCHIPDIDFRVWPYVGETTDVEVALVWNPPPKFYDELTGLRLVISLGAGADHLFRNGQPPPHILLSRIADPGLADLMTEYVLATVMSYHRQLPEYQRLQRVKQWHPMRAIPARQRSVGVMGLGELGTAAARALKRVGFVVAGWNRSARSIDGIQCFHGPASLCDFMASVEILVCLLPLNTSTRGMLNKRTLMSLRPGACLVNASRGGIVVEQDLIELLDSGHLGGATLDTFETEPLPTHSPLWVHPKVEMTPHVASHTTASSAAASVAESIALVRMGQPSRNPIDRDDYEAGEYSAGAFA